MLLQNAHGLEALTGRLRLGDEDAEAAIGRGCTHEQDGHDLGETVDEDGGVVLDELEREVGDALATAVGPLDERVAALDEALPERLKVLKRGLSPAMRDASRTYLVCVSARAGDEAREELAPCGHGDTLPGGRLQGPGGRLEVARELGHGVGAVVLDVLCQGLDGRHWH